MDARQAQSYQALSSRKVEQCCKLYSVLLFETGCITSLEGGTADRHDRGDQYGAAPQLTDTTVVAQLQSAVAQRELLQHVKGRRRHGPAVSEWSLHQHVNQAVHDACVGIETTSPQPTLQFQLGSEQAGFGQPVA